MEAIAGNTDLYIAAGSASWGVVRRSEATSPCENILTTLCTVVPLCLPLSSGNPPLQAARSGTFQANFGNSFYMGFPVAVFVCEAVSPARQQGSLQKESYADGEPVFQQKCGGCIQAD